MQTYLKKHTAMLCAVLFVVGLLLLLNAVYIGRGAASAALMRNGGMMDTEEYQFIMRSQTLGFQLAGTVCALLGGFGTLLLIYKDRE